MIALKTYQSHKRVQAAKITAIIVDGANKIYGRELKIHGIDLDVEGKVNRIIFNSEANELLRKPKPEIGMWYVLYPDGYFSFHPENFLDEYDKVEDAINVLDSEDKLLKSEIATHKEIIDKLVAENERLSKLLEQYEVS